MTRSLSLAEFWYLAEHVTGINADHTFPTKADVRAFLAGVQTDLKRGHYVDPSAGGITFGEYAGWWIEQRPLRPRCGTSDAVRGQLGNGFG